MPIAKSTPADISAITLLVNTAYRGDESKKGWTTEAHLLSGNRIDENTIAGYLMDTGITILKYTDDTGKLTGCVYLEDKTDYLYLGMLSVLPSEQAAGIGRTLLEAAEAYAYKKSLRMIRMTVISSRAELIAWYKRRGYIETGEILPFRVPAKFGIPNTSIELMVLQKELKA